MRFFFLLLLLSFHCVAQDFTTPFERSGGKESATYEQLMTYYQQLDDKYSTIQMEAVGLTDVAHPLHVVYYSGDGQFDADTWKQQHKIILLINNGIHPGEPDGIDACMMLLRDAAEHKIQVPDNVVLAVIPVYNVGGMLNRGSYSRANQNGPLQYGFRGNEQNLDLNRDFIKMDAKETRSLVGLFHKLDPDIFIDNHVSDGADYQHIMTLLATQHNKLGGEMGHYQYKTLVPAIFADMKERGYDMVPYVNDFDKTPDVGWREFYDPPRFSSGFATLFQTYAFVPETHMLKPYKDRVMATYELMRSFIKFSSKHAHDIQTTRVHDRDAAIAKIEFPIDWKVDTTRHDDILFKGYTPGYKPSEVSGQPRLYYDRTKPFTKTVPFYDHYLGDKKVLAPKAYVIQQGWGSVIENMQRNGVAMNRLTHDTDLTLTIYRIDKYESTPKPYEKHYLHKNVQYHREKQAIHLLAGDYIIPTHQPAKRYLVETLEPNAPDAFFAWNFFDAVLQEKEYYSDYVFEDMAAGMLKNNPELKKQLEDKKATDPAFAKDGAAQLDFVYRNSKYLEPVYMRYPVFRID